MQGGLELHTALRRGYNMNNELKMDSPQDEVHTLQFPPKVQMESITKKTQLVVISR